MAELETLVQNLIDNNVPEEEIGKFIQKHQSGQSVNPPTTQRFEQDFPTRRKVSTAARVVLEAGGLVAGSIVGTATAGPIGGVGGAGLGFAITSNVADRLDEFLGLTKRAGLKKGFKSAAEDIVEGSELEIGGAIFGKALSAGGVLLNKLSEKTGLTGFFRKMKGLFPAISDRAMLNKARDILSESRKVTPAAAKTAKETGEVLKRAGVRTEPTFAQRTGSQRAASFEQSMSAKDRELLEILKGKDAQINKEASDFLESQFKIGSAGEVVAEVSSLNSLN